MTHKTALIAGASGLVGQHCLEYLTQHKNYQKVISLVRSKMEFHHPKLEQLQIDFSKLESLELKDHVDDVFCCLGTTIKKAGSQAAFRTVDHDYPIALANCGLKANARQYLMVSSLGANPKSLSFYSRTKGEAEAGILKTAFNTVHIFRPSLLKGDRKEKRSGEDFANAITGWIPFWGPLLTYKPVEAKYVAKAMIYAANTPSDKTKNIYESDQIQKMARLDF